MPGEISNFEYVNEQVVRVHPIRQKLAAVVAAASLLPAGAAIIHKIDTVEPAVSNDPAPELSNPIDPQKNTQNICFTPTKQETSEVISLFTKPTSMEVQVIQNNVFSKRDEVFSELYQDTAEEMGMHMAIIPKILQIENYTYVDIPFSVLFAEAVTYFRQFNISLELGTENLEFNGRTPTFDDLDNPRAKTALLGYVKAMATFPVEVGRAFELKHLVLAHFEDLPDDQLAKGKSKSVGGYHEESTIVVEILLDKGIDPYTDDEYVNFRINELTSKTLLHELGHVVDQNFFCGTDMFDDIAFQSLNPKDLYDIDGSAKANSLGFYSQETFNAYYTDAQDPMYASNQVAYQAKVTSPNDYSFTGVEEDKATFLEQIFDANQLAYNINNLYRSPIMWQKYVFLTARLLRLFKPFIELLAKTSDHTDLQMDYVSKADIYTVLQPNRKGGGK